MRSLPRRGSLFWTLSASLLAVLVLAVVLQWLVAALLVEPGLRRWQQTQNVLVAERLAAAVATAVEQNHPEHVPRLVADHQREVEPARLFVRTSAGRWIGAPMPGMEGPRGPNAPFGGGWARRLEEARVAYERGADPSPAFPPVETVQPPRRAREGGDPRFDIVFGASVPVPGTAQPPAMVYVTAPRARLRVFTLLPRHAALYIPVAVLVAAGAGLLISHRLQRRIARLDALATRIGRGELDARIADPGTDELGHLGARLNEMAASLERASDEVRSLERQRSQLLADISHDLVTPLTTIRGFTETLLDERVPIASEDRRRHLQSVARAAERMDRLLGDLLDLARLEARTDVLQCEPLDLAALARNCVERFAPAFEQAGLALHFAAAPDAVWVHADGHRLEQVLDNLLGNALRHAPDPEHPATRVRVDVEVSVRDGRAELTVQDDGPGIEASDLPHVFDRFFRADRARSTPGSGLGLAIAREIVQRHGGSMRAEGRTPRGVRFTVELPMGT